jgi:hypothetical protein
MRIVYFIITVLFLMSSCEAGYGPPEDHSEFVSARLADDKHTVLFSFHHFVYRIATGLRAFPDGGVPDYVTDVTLLGIYDLQTLKLRILRREKNSEWMPGSGLFYIHSVKGSKALISRGGQLRGPFKLGIKYVLLDFESGTVVDLDLKSELTLRGRDSGFIYLVDSDGTLVFVTLSLHEAKDPGSYRNSALVPEIWVRTPGGEYIKAAASAHYQCTRSGEVIYWEPSTREFMAFSIADHRTRKAPEFKVPGYEDIDKSVGLSPDRKALESGVKVNGQWKYETLDLKPGLLK